jgi:hypothetical protein
MNTYRIDQTKRVIRIVGGPFWGVRNPVEGVINEMDKVVHPQ